MSGNTRNLRVLDELDRVGAARVLSNADVCVIDHAIYIENDILQDRTETQRLENIRLTFRREINRLGITPAFDVKNSIVGPDVFVIADQVSFRIG